MTAKIPAIRQSQLTASLQIPRDSKITEVRVQPGAVVEDQPPDLGPLKKFKGTFTGFGFNTIFRPQNSGTSTTVKDIPLDKDSNNILELNLTTETLSFPEDHPPQDPFDLGPVPNRGEVQGDIFLGGVRYLQTIKDVTTEGHPTTIHVEPGLWIIVPSTTHPAVAERTVARMASIPHGTVINAQGRFLLSVKGGPQIDPVDITPFPIGKPSNRLINTFHSLDFDNTATARIPQDLSIAPRITAALLKDPNTLLRNHIQGQNIVSTDVINIDTESTKSTIPGGGVVNIGFLMGDSTGPNAQVFEMSATFWVETVQTHIQVDPLIAGDSREVSPQVPAGAPAPTFLVTSNVATSDRQSVEVKYTQIQYTQNVSLNFNKLTWPHVSVATLVPIAPIPVEL
jgi:hypothetical protein